MFFCITKEGKIVKESKVLQRKNTQKICTGNKKRKIKIKAVVKNRVVNLGNKREAKHIEMK